jgi:hypothetical protein
LSAGARPLHEAIRRGTRDPLSLGPGSIVLGDGRDEGCDSGDSGRRIRAVSEYERNGDGFVAERDVGDTVDP